jgi:hypothetical protein
MKVGNILRHPRSSLETLAGMMQARSAVGSWQTTSLRVEEGCGYFEEVAAPFFFAMMPA